MDPKSRRPPPRPAEVNSVRISVIGTLLWAAALLALLPFADDLAAQGRDRWIPICVAGVVIGLLGIAYCRRREQRIRDHDPPPNR